MKTHKGVIKRNKILGAAAKVFAEKGYSECTLADIGAEAGTYAGSLYYYFSGKESLVEEVLNIGTTGVSNLVMGMVATLPPETDILDKIRIALETHMDQMLLRDEFVLAYWKIIDQVPEEIRLRHQVLPEAYGRFWQGLLREAQIAGRLRPDLDVKLMVLLMLGSTIYALDWFKPDGPKTTTQIADVLAEMFLFGAVPRSNAPVATSARSARGGDKPVAPAQPRKKTPGATVARKTAAK